MPVHDPHAALKNDTLKPFFKKHKSPHFVVEMDRGIIYVHIPVFYQTPDALRHLTNPTEETVWLRAELCHGTFLGATFLQGVWRKGPLDLFLEESVGKSNQNKISFVQLMRYNSWFDFLPTYNNQ